MSAVRGFDAAQARYDNAEPVYLPGGAEDGYESYLDDWDTEQREAWEKAMAGGHTDPVTFDEWIAENPPLDFEGWIDDTLDSLADEAADRQFERAREERWG